ncbi:trypsin-like peptidase domain-containing protein [Hahella sp. NBU794]|uniref:trypsin-like peptidase domain-containing protein n=1 Tax=Hahella sp. NBU794 TaxID=3422590 RepID=UPI003D6EF3EE
MSYTRVFATTFRLLAASLIAPALLTACSNEDAPAQPEKGTHIVIVEPKGQDKQAVDTHIIRSIQEAREAAVSISVGASVGSGFFINKDCLIVTNRHVVEFDNPALQEVSAAIDKVDRKTQEARERIATWEKQYPRYKGSAQQSTDQDRLRSMEKYRQELQQAYDKLSSEQRNASVQVKTLDGRTFAAHTVVKSEDTDLAFLVGAVKECRYFDAAVKTDPAVGQPTYTVGSPAGLEFTVTSGILSGIRDFEGVTLLQTDAAINPGNSGGPLLDANAKVIGVNTLRLSGMEGIGMAIPIATVKDQISRNLLLASGAPSQPATTTAGAKFDYDSYRENALRNAQPVAVDISQLSDACEQDYANSKYAAAMTSCKTSSSHGHQQGHFYMGKMLLDGLAGQQDYYLAADYMKKAAEAGNMEAQMLLGQMYQYGVGISPNSASALKWLTEAANQNSREALNSLGLIYKEGKIVYRSYEQAANYFEKAIAAGSTNALHNLGVMYIQGQGLAKNESKGFEHFLKAAQRGNPVSQLSVAFCYYKKLGVNKDYVEAYAWLTAAELNKKGKTISDWDPQRASEMKQFLKGIMNSKQLAQATAMSNDYVKRYSNVSTETSLAAKAGKL